MATMIEKAHGAATLREYRSIPASMDRGAVFFTRPTFDPEWKECIAEIKRFRSFERDWDGEGSLPPGPELVDAAISLTQCLKRNNEVRPIASSSASMGQSSLSGTNRIVTTNLNWCHPARLRERTVPFQVGLNISAPIGSIY